MWTVIYERHLWNELDKTSKFQSRYFWIAWGVYQTWALSYSISIMPVKQISLYYSKAGVIQLSKNQIRNREQLQKIKRKK